MAESLGTRRQRVDRQHVLKAMDHLRTSALFKEYQANPNTFVPRLGELAALLRCRVDAEAYVWSKRFAMLKNQARLAAQDDVLAFLEQCQTLRAELAR